MNYHSTFQTIIHVLPKPKKLNNHNHNHDYDYLNEEQIKINKFLNRISRSHKNFIYNDNLDDYINDKNSYKYNRY
tara:strand:+ start:801 stop:1025 length:225 start_codon:yes stop_codon:yes gene_type:complete